MFLCLHVLGNLRDIRLKNEPHVVQDILPPLTKIPPAMFGKTIRRSRHCGEVRALRLVVGMLEHEALQTHQKITVRTDGRPHAVVVWFLWDGEAILIFKST